MIAKNYLKDFEKIESEQRMSRLQNTGKMI